MGHSPGLSKTRSAETVKNMFSYENISDSLKERINQVLLKDEKIELVFVSELSLTGRFVKEIIIVSNKRLANLGNIRNPGQDIIEILLLDIEQIVIHN
ncbi:MAG: hypothetical protein ACOCV3_06775, partial [Halanaerobiales bacterium]